MSTPPGPLAHLRVLDLSRVLAGPWSGQLLGDLGADVVKVERPGAGDDTRAWGPPWLGGDAPRADGMSSYFLSCNRNKRSIAIDLAADAELVRQLAGVADVVLENFKPGTLERYGIGPHDLLRLNPRLVVASISGFGHTGPDRDRAGYDLLIQAMGGLMSVTGDPSGPPQKTGVAISDLMTGMYATVAVLAALAHRDRTGEGQHIDLALLDTQLAWMANQATATLATGRAPARMGNAHPSIAPYEVFEARDGWLVLAVGNDAQFSAFAQLSGHPAWATDPRFATNAARVAHREVLRALVADAIAQRDRADWTAACLDAGVPCGPIHDLAEAFGLPQARARGAVVEQPDRDGATVRTPANPIHFSATPVRYDRPPPRVDEHRAEILRDWLGGPGPR